MRGTEAIALAFICAVLAFPATAGADVTLEPVGDFGSPMFVTSEPGNPDRLLVVEKDGRIVASQDGVQSTVLDIQDMVSNAGERGLLSMAFPADYAETGLIYVFYVRSDVPDPSFVGDLQIDEFRIEDGVAVPESQRHVIRIDHSSSSDHHNGGQLQFGPDGFLYIATGDGAVNAGTAQDTDTLLGKLLRIWPRPGAGTEYTIPEGNPFRGDIDGSDQIWSYGLRNPWRFSFDRLTGDLVIADVGAGEWEEIDYEPAPDGGRGDNFGWNTCEGSFLLGTSEPCDFGTAPSYAYGHTDGRCAITGGYVVRDPSLPALYGRYLFADLCTGELLSADLGLPTTDVRSEGMSVETPSTFGEDSCGRVYVAELGGAVYRLAGDTPADCDDPGDDPGGGDPGGDDPGDEEPVATCGGEAVTQSVPDAGGRIDGTSGRDVIVGTDEADRIVAHGGGDVICGGAGDDTVKGDTGDDTVKGGAGDDTVKGGGADDGLGGGAGADGLIGGAGEDRCKGGPGPDVLKGC